MPLVHLPTHLAEYTGGTARVDAAGATLDDVLRALDRRFPGVRFRVVDEAGRLRRHVRLFVGGRATDDLGTRVGEDDEVHLMAALSGG